MSFQHFQFNIARSFTQKIFSLWAGFLYTRYTHTNWSTEGLVGCHDQTEIPM